MLNLVRWTVPKPTTNNQQPDHQQPDHQQPS